MREFHRHRLSNASAKALAILVIGTTLTSAGIANEGPALGDAPAGGMSVGPVALESHKGIASQLPLLVTTPQRRRLSAELKLLLRRGDLTSAERRLNQAVEEGSLAILLLGELRNPGLLSGLEALAVDGGNPSLPSQDTAQAIPSTDETAELLEALEREKAGRTALAKELVELTQTYGASQASTEVKISKLENALQHEHRRSEAIARQLSGAQEELRTVQARRAADDGTASSLAGVKEALVRERARSDGLARELAKAARERPSASAPEASGLTPTMLRLETVGAQPPLPQPLKTWVAQESQASQTTGAIAPPPATKPKKAAASGNLPPSEPRRAAVERRTRQVHNPLIALPSTDAETAEMEPEAQPDETDNRLAGRANSLLRKGNVVGARRLLEEAMEAGSASAAFLLAQTFDPQVLPKVPTLRVRGDAAKARKLYARARAMNIQKDGAAMEAREWVTWQE